MVGQKKCTRNVDNRLLIHSITTCSRIHPEKLTGSHLVMKFPTFYGAENSLPHSQVLTTCPYPKPHRSSQCPYIPLPEDPSSSDVYWTVHHCDNWRIKNQLDATYYFIVLLIGSTCFRHYYAHNQELASIMLITTLVISFLVCCRLEVRCG